MIAHLESERCVLGAMFRSATAATTAIERLRPDDFADPGNREVFSAMLTLGLGSGKIDLTTVDAELSRRGKLEVIGGPERLVDIAHGVPVVANLDSYISVVLEKANLRRLQAIAEAINRRTAAQEMTADQIIELIEGACNDITVRGQERDAGWISGAEAAKLAMDAAERKDKPIPTGFQELDGFLCGGLTKPELTIVGARPGKGKSAFLLAASMNAAESGAHVGYFSLEMSAVQIGQRELAATSRVSVTKQRGGAEKLTDADWAALTEGVTRLGDTGLDKRLHIYQSYGLTIERLGNIARHAVRRGEMDLLVLDYIQLLKTAERTHQEFERLGAISKGLKQLALELDIPILTAAQVRRQGQDDAKKGGRAPTLDELRGSGDLEQDADNVLLIHTPTGPDDATLKHLDPWHEGIWQRANDKMAQVFTVEIAKQRQGPTCRTWCIFRPEIMRFETDKGDG